MKKVATLFFAMLIMLAIPMVSFAEDLTIEEETIEETAAEAGETTAEADTAETAEETAAAENEAQTEPDELDGLLDVATPEQIENIKKYIEYGVASLPISERIKLIILDHVETLAWLIAAVAFIVFCVFNRLTGKRSDDNARVLTDNAIEIAERGMSATVAARSTMEKLDEEIRERIAAVGKQTEALTDKTLEEMKEIAEGILEEAAKIEERAEEALADLARKESGLAETVTLFCSVVGYLVENSTLPEWERDRMTAMIAEGKSKIEEVTSHDETVGE
jgi:uncharacterized protein YoxC